VFGRGAGAGGGAIRSVLPQDETIVRLGGVGDGYKMTWTADDRQLMPVNDGSGWSRHPTAFYNSRLWSVTGGPREATFEEVTGYPDLNNFRRSDEAPRYYGHGILAVKGRLYQFLGTLDRATDRPRHWTGAKLIYSDDGGRSWCNQDGSSPVIWEDWDGQTGKRLLFFREPQGSFSLICLLQMGRAYSGNRDGYVYGYSPNGSLDGQMNQLVMFRVPAGRMLDRAAYEFFAGTQGGRARWVPDIIDRAPVHVFPRGWVNRTNLFSGDLVVESWLPSVVYNEALDIYLMACAGIGCAADGTEFGKPSYLGFWVSSTPWGPWRQVHEESAWTPGNDREARAYAPQIAPKWLAADGRSFWLVWADLQGIRDFVRDRSVLAAQLQAAQGPRAKSAVIAEFHRRYLPRYAFNAQRVRLL